MILQELTDMLENPDRIRIIEGEKEVYIGFFALLKTENKLFEKIKTAHVKAFRVIPEIRHKDWEKLNLMRPLEPEETAEFRFRDLEMKLYYTIHIEEETS